MRKILFLFFLFTFALFLPWKSPASEITINILTPKESDRLSDAFLISAKIDEKGKPFTEFGGLKWVTAIIKDSRGVDSLRVRLQDAGVGEDSKSKDGIWTSFTKLKLPDGEYSISLVVKKDKETFLSGSNRFFIDSGSSAEAKKIEERFGETISPMVTDLKNLRGQLINTEDFLRKELVALKSKYVSLIRGISIVGILLIFSLTLLIILPRVRLKIRKPDEKWSPVFTALENMGKEIEKLQKDLSGNYRVLERYKEDFKKAVLEMFNLYENVKKLKEIPKENVNAFKITLKETVENLGVEEWEPEIGKPVPEGCEQELATEETPYPEGTVVKVLSPGYRITNVMLIKKPRVLVAGSKNYKKEVKNDKNKY